MITYTLHNASRCTFDGSTVWIAAVYRGRIIIDTFEEATSEDAEHAMRFDYPNAVPRTRRNES